MPLVHLEKRFTTFMRPGRSGGLRRADYEVEGERRFESPKDVTRSARFLAELSRDLTLIGRNRVQPIEMEAGFGTSHVQVSALGSLIARQMPKIGRTP